MADDTQASYAQLAVLISESLRESKDEIVRVRERMDKISEGMSELREIRVKVDVLQSAVNAQSNAVNSLQSMQERTGKLESRLQYLEDAIKERSGDQHNRLTLWIAMSAAVGTAIQALYPLFHK